MGTTVQGKLRYLVIEPLPGFISQFLLCFRATQLIMAAEMEVDALVDQILEKKSPKVLALPSNDDLNKIGPFSRTFSPFSAVWWDQMKSIFDVDADLAYIESIRKAFPTWTLSSKRKMASFWFGSQEDRKKLYTEEALRKVLPPLSKSACEVCHLRHDRSKKPNEAGGKPKSRSGKKVANSTPNARTTRSTSKSSHELPQQRSRAMRKGTKKVTVEELAETDIDDVDYNENSSDSTDSEESWDCHPCTLSSAFSKGGKVPISGLLENGCSRLDFHPQAILSITKNDWEDEVKRVAEKVETWFEVWKKGKLNLGEDRLNSSVTSSDAPAPIKPSSKPFTFGTGRPQSYVRIQDHITRFSENSKFTDYSAANTGVAIFSLFSCSWCQQ